MLISFPSHPWKKKLLITHLLQTGKLRHRAGKEPCPRQAPHEKPHVNHTSSRNQPLTDQILVQEADAILSEGLVRQDQIMRHSDLESITHELGSIQNTIQNGHCLLRTDSMAVPVLNLPHRSEITMSLVPFILFHLQNHRAITLLSLKLILRLREANNLARVTQLESCKAN